jgi:hypothetical protein
MKRACAVLLLAAMTANCAARGPALARTSGIAVEPAAPQIGAVPDVWRQYAQQLRVGSVVRVRTASGERLTATLLAAGADSIAVSLKTRVPEPVREIRFETIQQLEVVGKQGSSAARAVAIGAGVGAGVFFGLLLFALAAWD